MVSVARRGFAAALAAADPLAQFGHDASDDPLRFGMNGRNSTITPMTASVVTIQNSQSCHGITSPPS